MRCTKRSHLNSILIVIMAACAVYANTLRNGFVYDDLLTVIGNAFIKDAANLPSLFDRYSYFTLSGETSYRPVVTFTYFLDYSLFGLKAWGYHLTNILLHALNSVLLYIFLSLLKRKADARGREAEASPFLLSLLFAAHPVLTEAVNAISFREDLLAFLFYITTFCLYLVLSSYTKSAFRRPVYIISCIIYFLALLSKEMAATLPLIIFCYTWIYRDKKPILLNPCLVGYIAVTAAYLYLRFYYFYSPLEENIRAWEPIERVLTIPWLIMNYLKLTLFPVQLSADYVISPVRSIFSISFLLPLIAVASLAAAALALRKRKKGLSFGIFFLIITLIPVYNLIPIANSLAERYLYLPTAGSAIIIGSVIHLIFKNKNSYTLLLPFLVILSIYALLAVKRNGVWIDDYTLWNDTIKKAPSSNRAYKNLGWWSMKAGEYDEAINAYRKSLSLNDTQKDLHFNIGVMFSDMGRFDEAIQELEKELAIDPDNIKARVNLGGVYGIQGKQELAAREFKKVLEIDPNNQMAVKNMGVALEKMKEAMPDFIYP